MKKVLETLAQIHDHAAEPTEGWGGRGEQERERKKVVKEGSRGKGRSKGWSEERQH